MVAAALDAWAGPGSVEPSCWPEHRGVGGWLVRVLAGDLAYVVVYVTAGMIVWPFVRPFYEQRAMPAMPTILGLQIFRGLVFVGLLAWLARELRSSRRVAVLLGGLALSVFACVRAPRAQPVHAGLRTLGASGRGGDLELPVRSLCHVDADGEAAGRLRRRPGGLHAAVAVSAKLTAVEGRDSERIPRYSPPSNNLLRSDSAGCKSALRGRTKGEAMAGTTRRTTRGVARARSSTPCAMRAASSKDIQSYARAHRADLKKKSAAEKATAARKAAKKVAKKAVKKVAK